MYNWLANWCERHQHPASQVLHAIGIPLTIVGVVVIVLQTASSSSHLWPYAAGLLIVGYFLQWVGHRIEGNDMGELILLKKVFGKPYVAISPRYARRRNSSD